MADKNKGRAPPPKKPSAKVPVKTASETDWDRVVAYRRVKDVEGARTIFNRMLVDNIARSNTISQTRNQLEGGRPFAPEDMEAQGMAGLTNVNFGDAKAARDRVVTPYWQLINDVPHRAVFKIAETSPHCGKWENAFSEAFDWFHENWPGYKDEFMKLVNNFVDLGPGGAQFDTEDSPRYKSINVQRLYWPKNTQMNPESWEVLAFVRDVGASELYGKIRDQKTSKTSEDAGWNINGIKSAIVSMGQQGSGQFPDYRDYTRFQDLLVNNDIVITTPFQPLSCVWLFVRNFPENPDEKGKIGCYVFTQNVGVEEFLFVDDKSVEEWEHLLGIIWYDTGTDGMIHSIKGFGIKNFFFSSLINRLKCRMVDGASVAAAINFQYGTDNIPEETPPVENYGWCNVFPGGMTQLTVYPQLDPAGKVLEMLTANRDQNNALYNQQQQQIENSDTATQAKILSQMQGQLNVAQAAVFLAQVGINIYTEQIRRLRLKGNKDKDAKRFVKRLQDRGVPDNVIHDSELLVKTGANSGMANPILMAQKFKEDLAGFAMQPGVNAQWFRENYVAYTYGANAMNQAFLPQGQGSEPEQRWKAMVENSMFGQGLDLPVAPEDAHFEHLQEHLKPLAGIIQAFQKTQTISPEATSALTLGIEHSGQHMQFLSQDETQKQQLQQITPVFRQVQSVARGILTRMQSQKQNPGQTPISGGGAQPSDAQPSNGAAPGANGKPPTESISVNFKDMPPAAKAALLQQFGLPSNGVQATPSPAPAMAQ